MTEGGTLRTTRTIDPPLGALSAHPAGAVWSYARRMKSIGAVLAGLLCLAASADASQGELNILTYNVAGLPAFLSGGEPAKNSKLISPRLIAFDLVLLQEDFHYRKDIMSATDFPYLVTPRRHGIIGFGDGLLILSRFAVAIPVRKAWKDCNGFFTAKSDCLTPKGFTVAELELAPGVVIDVYNLHMDAGPSRHDSAARLEQVEQLVAFMKTRPAERAVIMGGDTNMRLDDESLFQTLLHGAGLTDACRALMCAEQGRFDRIMYRDGARVRIDALSWVVPSADFRDAAGAPLSDHEPVTVRLGWSTRE